MGNATMRIFTGMAGLIVAAAAVTSAQAGGFCQPAGYKDSSGFCVPYSIWAGLYVGANVGGAFDTLSVNDINAYALGAAPGTRTDVKTDAFFGGVSAGYNIQQSNFVFGVEADIGGMSLSDTKLLTGTASGTVVGIDSGLYGDVTGRLGYNFGHVLIYGKGGFAFYQADDRFSTGTGSFSRATTAETFTGWTAGGGIEYKINTAWSFKLEYQYFDFGSENFTVFNAVGTPFHFKDDLTVNTVKVGANYWLSPGYAPLK
jgi:outer membrane immunogenic protein